MLVFDGGEVVVVEVANEQPPSKTSMLLLIFDGGDVVEVKTSKKTSKCVLVFNGGDMVVANKQPPSKTSNVCSFSMVKRWWRWQTSSHHRE